MEKIFKIGPILLTIVLFSYSLSFGDQATNGISPTNSSNELNYGPSILHQKRVASSSSLHKPGFGITLYGSKASEAIGNREVPINSEITKSLQSPATNEFQKKGAVRFRRSFTPWRAGETKISSVRKSALKGSLVKAKKER